MRTHLNSKLVLPSLMLGLVAGCNPDAKSASGDPAALRPASPTTKLVRGRQTKVLVDASDLATRSRLKSATLAEHDYGSFVMLVLDEELAGGRGRLEALPVRVRDDFDLVRLEGRTIDAFDPSAVWSTLDASLKNERVLKAFTTGEAPSQGLYIVQLVGPMKDEWRAALEGEGLSVVTYVPENAYVVFAKEEAAAVLPRLLDKYDFVQLVVDYEPAFKLAPSLRALTKSVKLDVVVQVVKTPGFKDTILTLESLSSVVRGSADAGEYVNVDLTIDSGKLTDLAHLDEVFAIEPRTPRRRLDEAQGQIVAGNITGNVPTGPGYLAWHDSKGFTSAQFQSFVVHVVDDSHQLTGTSQHGDLPATRVAFQNNPTNASSTQDGHGFLNTHIIGGYNVGTGTANEDTSGFNYGLGIAPYARMGVTNIFGNSFATATNWESTAYTSGSRISSNSWGYISVFRYDTSAQEFDRIVRDAQTATGLQQLVVVFAAGNDGPGANTVASPATAKNVITVGASENVRQTGTDGCAVGNTGANSCNDIINFSSRGPVNSTGGDGRIKPDIVAPGTHIQAGVPQSGASYTGLSVCNRYWPAGQTLYGWSSGTSHSCPAVAGGAALVYQDFLNQSLPVPSPAMVKAMLMSSATRMTGTGANDTLPSNSQGMGRMDLGRALDRTPRILVDQTQVLGATGNTYQVTGSVSNSAVPFRVTLAWSDAAGPTTGAPWVNNLDLTVSINGSTYLGNVFSGGASVTGGTASTRDNAESVFLPAGTTGSFTITVTGANIAGDGVPGNADTTDQDFALVVYNGSTAAASPTIGVAPASLSFSGTAGGASPASQTLSVTNTGGGALAWTAASSQTWLTVSPASGTAPSTLTVTAATGVLAAGTYTANITLTGTGATNSPVTVPVTFTVAAAPALAVSPTSLSFSGTAGGASPASQTVSISNTGGGTLSWNATSNQTWLTVSPASGTAPSTLTVSAATAGLAAGSYSGAVTITSAGVSGSPATVAVTLTVAEGGTPAIGVSPASLAFSATEGGASPASLTLSVSNAGTGGTLAWAASSDQTWLTVSPASGTAPSTITVTAATGALAAGTYSANVTLSGTGATNSPVVVPVTFTVAAAPAVLVVSPTSLSFTGAAGGASPASQTVSVSNTGGGTLSWNATSSQTWLTVSPASGTAPSTLTVSANTTGLSAGTYTGAVTVTAAGATGSPATVAVTLTVTGSGTELIINGALEGTATAWNRYGTAQAYVANGASPHGGTGYMTLGLVNSGVATVGQQFTVPASGSLTLSYWVRVTTAETTTTTGFDTMWTEIRSNTGALLQTVATTTNLSAATMGSYTLQTFTLTGYSGQTIRLIFRTFTNASNVTTFFVDDVSLVAQ